MSSRRGELPLLVLTGHLDRVSTDRGVPHLLAELEHCVDQHFRSRRAAGQVHVHWHDMINTLDDRVVVEHAAGAGTHAHGQYPLRVGHLVVDLTQHRGHLLADSAGDDHQVCLPRRRPEDLLPPSTRVIAGGAVGHHLDRATRQSERRRPEGGTAHVTEDVLECGQQDTARQLLFYAHGSLPCWVSPNRVHLAATRRRWRRTPWQ